MMPISNLNNYQDNAVNLVNSLETNIAVNPLLVAEKSILDSTGDLVSVWQKAKFLRKFGRNPSAAGSFETVWQTGGDETYVTTDAIDTVSSSDAGDTQEIVIEGHTISNGLLTFSTQTATLDGQNKVVLATPLARMTRLYNNGTSDFAGTVYGYEDDTVTAGVPDTASKVHLTVTNGNQSEKASTSISSTDYLIVTGIELFVFTKTDETVEFIGEFREVAETPKVWRRVYSATSNSKSNAFFEAFNPPIIVPKNHDIRLRAKSDGTAVDIGGAFSGYLAEVVT